MAFYTKFLAAFLLLPLAGYGAGVKTLTVPAGMVEVPIEVTVGADITWDPLLPVTLDFKLDPTSRVLFTHSSYAVGGQIVVVSDVIDWDAKKRDKTRWIITISGAAPPIQPTPVDPTPPPVEPTPPPPTDVSNAYGVGGVAYYEARKVGRPADAAMLSDAFKTAYVNLHKGSWLPARAADEVNTAATSLPPEWKPWILSVSAALKAAKVTHGSGITVQRDMFREISEALAEAAK